MAGWATGGWHGDTAQPSVPLFFIPEPMAIYKFGYLGSLDSAVDPEYLGSLDLYKIFAVCAII